ncbi:unnamed protein product, partial [Ectocarpus sp. 12 AP-2014]
MDKTNFIEDEFVSVIVCASYLNEKSGHSSLGDLSSALHERSFSDFEIIIIADKPLLFSRAQVEEFLSSYDSIRYIDSISELTEAEAVELGLKLSIGDYVVYMHPEDVSIIGDLVYTAKKYGKVVVGVENNPDETVFYRLFRPLFKLVEGSVGYHLPRRATSLRCFSRHQVNAYTSILNSADQVFLRIDQIADGYTAFRYRKSEGVKKRLFSKLQEAASLLVNNSTKPLRFASLLGVLGSFSAFIFACYSFLSHFMKNEVVSGWSSLVVIVSFLFFILFLILVLIGEYLARILHDLKGNDRSGGLKEFHSKVMLSGDRINVFDDSKKND